MYKYPIMKKYRIILKDILCDGMDENEVREALQMFHQIPLIKNMR